MQFLVIGHDDTDPAAQARRMAARPAHLELGRLLTEQGRRLFAAALLDEEERMVGSAIVAEVASRAELDAWLAEEPYVTGGVWARVEVTPCRASPNTRPAKD